MKEHHYTLKVTWTGNRGEGTTGYADYDRDQPVSGMRCLLEQGLVCMGPVTAGGCGGKNTPLCLQARVPCRGCYGPVQPGGNQLLDMMNAFALQRRPRSAQTGPEKELICGELSRFSL